MMEEKMIYLFDSSVLLNEFIFEIIEQRRSEKSQALVVVPSRFYARWLDSKLLESYPSEYVFPSVLFKRGDKEMFVPIEI